MAYLTACTPTALATGTEPPATKTAAAIFIPTEIPPTIEPTTAAILPTVEPIAATITPTLPPSSPTSTPLPEYPTKQVIFRYYFTENLASDLAFFTKESCCSITTLVIYSDGQMILNQGQGRYQQKSLSAAERDSFFSKIETLGFFNLESNQEHDPSDALYHFGDQFEESHDGLYDCVFVNGDQPKKLCIRDHLKEYVIPEMITILDYLDGYTPAGLVNYEPERILLTIQKSDTKSHDPSIVSWPEHFPPMETNDESRYAPYDSIQVLYIDGNMANEIYQFFENTDHLTVLQNNQEYFVNYRVILAHEALENPTRY